MIDTRVGLCVNVPYHYDDVIMGAIASQITSLTIVYSTVYSGADQSKHQSSASLAFVWGIHRGPVNSPHKWPVTRKMLPFDDFIMCRTSLQIGYTDRQFAENILKCSSLKGKFSILIQISLEFVTGLLAKKSSPVEITSLSNVISHKNNVVPDNSCKTKK